MLYFLPIFPGVKAKGLALGYAVALIFLAAKGGLWVFFASLVLGGLSNFQSLYAQFFYPEQQMRAVFKATKITKENPATIKGLGALMEGLLQELRQQGLKLPPITFFYSANANAGPLAYCAGGYRNRYCIFISSFLIQRLSENRLLDVEALKAVLCHELRHALTNNALTVQVVEIITNALFYSASYFIFKQAGFLSALLLSPLLLFSLFLLQAALKRQQEWDADYFAATLGYGKALQRSLALIFKLPDAFQLQNTKPCWHYWKGDSLMAFLHSVFTTDLYWKEAYAYNSPSWGQALLNVAQEFLRRHPTPKNRILVLSSLAAQLPPRQRLSTPSNKTTSVSLTTTLKTFGLWSYARLELATYRSHASNNEILVRAAQNKLHP